MGQRAQRGGDRQGGDQRGMVTLEVALGLLSLTSCLTVVVWLVAVLMAQLQIVDTATVVARQAARGDEAAVTRAEEAALPGAEITTDIDGGMARVTVHYEARPFGPRFLSVPLSARAEVAMEP